MVVIKPKSTEEDLHISYTRTIGCDSVVDNNMYLNWATIEWELLLLFKLLILRASM